MYAIYFLAQMDQKKIVQMKKKTQGLDNISITTLRITIPTITKWQLRHDN